MKVRALCATGFVVATLLTGGSALAADAPAPVAAPAPGASPELITRVDAVRLMQATFDYCLSLGHRPSVLVSDANGNMRAAISDDGANASGIASTFKKTSMVLTFKTSTQDLMERLKTDKAFADQNGKNPNYFFQPGGFPIYRQDKLVAVIAVAGAHGPGDAACALEGLKALPWASVQPRATGRAGER